MYFHLYILINLQMCCGKKKNIIYVFLANTTVIYKKLKQKEIINIKKEHECKVIKKIVKQTLTLKGLAKPAASHLKVKCNLLTIQIRWMLINLTSKMLHIKIKVVPPMIPLYMNMIKMVIKITIKGQAPAYKLKIDLAIFPGGFSEKKIKLIEKILLKEKINYINRIHAFNKEKKIFIIRINNKNDYKKLLKQEIKITVQTKNKESQQMEAQIISFQFTNETKI
jgi:hypothetical protein